MAISQDTAYGFGQLGSVFTDTADSPITPPTGKVFVAITFLEDTQLEITSGTGEGLTADTTNTASEGLEYVGTAAAAHNLTVGSETAISGGGGLTGILSKGKDLIGGLTGAQKITGALALGGAFAGMEDQQVEELKRNPEALRGYLAQYYRKLNKGASEQEIAKVQGISHAIARDIYQTLHG